MKCEEQVCVCVVVANSKPKLLVFSTRFHDNCVFIRSSGFIPYHSRLYCIRNTDIYKTTISAKNKVNTTFVYCEFNCQTKNANRHKFRQYSRFHSSWFIPNPNFSNNRRLVLHFNRSKHTNPQNNSQNETSNIFNTRRPSLFGHGPRRSDHYYRRNHHHHCLGNLQRS